MSRVPGSERPTVSRASVDGPADPAEVVAVTLVLRRETGAPATAADVELVTATVADRGLSVTSTHAASGRVQLSGSVADLEQVFGTRLEQARTAEGEPFRHRTGELSVPDELDDVVVAVLGLDNRVQARSQARAAAAASTSYTPVELGTAYRFPAGTDGTGQHVGIVELGGGYVQADLDTYFTGLGVGSPQVTSHDVDGATNLPGKDPQGADGEVMLDIEVVGALAPAAGIEVYFAPNTDAGFLDAVSEAIHGTPTPAAVSISWGQSEDQWTAQARTALDQAMADGASLGVTVCVAAGDHGSSDGQSGGGDHVDFPASSPHALACGGTTLRGGSETVWNDGAQGGATGGGISDTFAQPAWQTQIPATTGGRGVPDVAGDADPQTGYRVRVDGQDLVIGGTSAVAPLWAALVARLAQSLGRPLGLLQPQVYFLGAGFTDITSGDNGSYSARPGWDACTGLGTPDGTALLQALQSVGSPG